MGYQTDYFLSVSPVEGYDVADNLPRKAIDRLRLNSAAAYALLEPDGSNCSSGNWGSLIEDIETVSKEFPCLLFEVYGNGDGEDDKWRLYVVNGHSQQIMLQRVEPLYHPSLLTYAQPMDAAIVTEPQPRVYEVHVPARYIQLHAVVAMSVDQALAKALNNEGLVYIRERLVEVNYAELELEDIDDVTNTDRAIERRVALRAANMDPYFK